MASVRMMPSPGTWKPKSASLCIVSGSRRSDSSISVTSRFSTHSVMPSGIQTRRPATNQRLSVDISAYASPEDAAGLLGVAGLESAGLASPPDFDSAPFDSAPVDSLFESLFAAGFEDGLLRKSVTYQPLPFSWNPAAVTIFVNVGLPHWVQTVSGASLTFCRNSRWWPQLSQ